MQSGSGDGETLMAKERKARFREEPVAAIPSGWKVRTAKHDSHRVRLAFPAGRKQNNPGRLVAVLHPAGETSCTMRSSNPSELLVMSANPPRRRNGSMAYRVVALSRDGGANFEAPAVPTKAEARAQLKKVDKDRYFSAHIQKIRSNPAELLVMAANPQIAGAHGSNPPAAEIFEKFSGVPSEFVTIDNEPHMPPGDYAQLGKLLNLYVKPVKGGQQLGIQNFGKNAPMVVCATSTKQIYFYKGNQDISEALDDFGAKDLGGGLYELGTGKRIDYQARKEHVAEPDEDKWKHHFGEEDGIYPLVLFDARHKKIMLTGGNYRVEGPWIMN